MSSVELDGVTRRFPVRRQTGSLHALGPFDLSIDAGGFVALVGPSGCGKSSLLRLVAGLDIPDAGTIRLGGEPVSGPVSSCGMVFQAFSLFPWLTLRGNVAFGLSRRITSKTDRLARADALLAAVGLDEFAEHYPNSLSGGMKQRGALARALATEPELLLLDEPFGALDQQTRGLMQEMLETLWREKRRTVLLVTHDVEEALFLADRVVLMSARPGRVLGEYACPFERPRLPELKSDPAFTSLKGQVSAELRREVLASA